MPLTVMQARQALVSALYRWADEVWRKGTCPQMCVVPGLRRIINCGVQGRDPSDVQQLCSLTTPTSFLSLSLCAGPRGHTH